MPYTNMQTALVAQIQRMEAEVSALKALVEQMPE
jgi:hypothetical protein